MPGCGGDIRLIAFITDPASVRKVLKHLGEPRELPSVSSARGPPTDWADLVQQYSCQPPTLRRMTPMLPVP